MENKMNYLTGGRPVRTAEIMENMLFSVKLQEQYVSCTTIPENFGLLAPDNEYHFDFGLVENTVYLKSLHALLPNGHLIRYAACHSHADFLELSLEPLAAGEYYIFLVYKGWSPVVSSAARGKTVLPDSYVPSYELKEYSALKSIRDYPHCLLLGKLRISPKAVTPPEMIQTALPLIAQAGAHSLTLALLRKTKAQAEKLIEASEQILSQVQLTPANSIFRDTRMLAEKQLDYLNTKKASVQRWDVHTPLFDLYCFWAVLAKIYRDWLDSDLVTQRLHSHDLLHQSGARVGQIRMEHYLVSSIHELLEYDYALDENSQVLRLVEQFMAYPVLAWLALGDGTPIPVPTYNSNQHQIKSISR